MAKHKKNELSYTNALGAQYARDPTPETAGELLNAFQGFIQNYVTLLSPKRQAGAKTRLTRNTKEFLRLFASKVDLAQDEDKAYQIVLRRLPNMAKQSLMDDDDLEQSIILAFLNVARKFDQSKCGDGGTFTGYVDTHFKWALKPMLFHSHEDAAKYQPLHDEVLDEQSFFGEDVDYDESGVHVYSGYEVIEGVITEIKIDLPLLTPAFVSSPNSPYDILLTKQERAILVKHLRDDKSPSAIASELGYSNAAAVRTIYDNAIKKIQEHLQPSGEKLC